MSLDAQLGYATTEELLAEIKARMSQQQLLYRTVDEPCEWHKGLKLGAFVCSICNQPNSAKKETVQDRVSKHEGSF